MVDSGGLHKVATKVNLKKYLVHEGKWQCVPVPKADGKLDGTWIDSQPVCGVLRVLRRFYLEWREDGKQRQTSSSNEMRMPGGRRPRMLTGSRMADRLQTSGRDNLAFIPF